MKKKKIILFAVLATFGILYQNCALQNLRNRHRDVRLESDAKVEVADKNGKMFLSWNFIVGGETIVEITNSGNSFCKRGFVLKSEAEKEWYFALSKIKVKRNTASANKSKNLTIKYKGATSSLTESESQAFFELMENTKKDHNVKIIHCDGRKKWSFKNVKIEVVTLTKARSKMVQTFTINLINDKLEMRLDEQPIKITKNQDEAFCNYTGMTYSPSAKLLTAMFSIEEVYKNVNLSGSRGLASSIDNPIMLEIDERTKYTIDAESALGHSIIDVIQQMKIAKAAKKTCGYTY